MYGIDERQEGDCFYPDSWPYGHWRKAAKDSFLSGFPAIWALEEIWQKVLLLRMAPIGNTLVELVPFSDLKSPANKCLYCNCGSLSETSSQKVN